MLVLATLLTAGGADWHVGRGSTLNIVRRSCHLVPSTRIGKCKRAATKYCYGGRRGVCDGCHSDAHDYRDPR
jgi:hypothetical protein